MAGQEFRLDVDRGTKSGISCSRNFVLAIVASVCIAFTVGILIGHFAISKDSVSSRNLSDHVGWFHICSLVRGTTV